MGTPTKLRGDRTIQWPYHGTRTAGHIAAANHLTTLNHAGNLLGCRHNFLIGLLGNISVILRLIQEHLLGLLLILAVHSVMLPSAKEGLSFYLIPDLSKINGKVAVGAMNQAFFTLSVGIGGMAIFGSYIDKERSLAGEAVNVIVLDTLVAVIAGLIIFPACFSYGLEVTSGPSLLFDTMANVFTHMPGGRWWGTAFFLFMVFAAMSTVLGVSENILQ